jgi:hypothetical protein
MITANDVALDHYRHGPLPGKRWNGLGCERITILVTRKYDPSTLASVDTDIVVPILSATPQWCARKVRAHREWVARMEVIRLAVANATRD